MAVWRQLERSARQVVSFVVLWRELCQECSAKFFWYLRLGVLSHRVNGGSPAAEP